MERIIQFFVERSFYVHLITALILIAGVLSITQLNRDLIPPFEWNSIEVVAGIPGASPEEIEKFVTYPIEEALEGLAGVERTRSVSSPGSMQLTLFFNAAFENMVEATESVSSKVSSIRYRLPNQVRDITIQRRKVTDVFLIWLGLENFDQTNSSHRKFFIQLEERLLDIPGVNQSWTNFRKRNIHVEMAPKKLAYHEVSISDVRQVLSSNLELAPVGQTKVGSEDFMVIIQRGAQDIESIKNLPIRSNLSGGHLKLSDVAHVHWKLVDSDEIAFINGNPGITLNITKSVGTDAIALKRKVTKVLEEMQALAPAGVKVLNIVDGPQFIERQLDVLKKNGAIGLILVFLILMLFLNGWIAMMTAIGLPIAYFGTASILYLLGIDIDLISLVGMILVIGILVDDAIIVSEKYAELIDDGLPPKKAATEAVNQLVIPVTGTVLTTMVAFAPLIFIKSEMSKIFFAIPIVVLTALALSWFESFFILPNHLAHHVPHNRTRKKQSFFLKIKSRYESLLSVAISLRYPLVVIAFSIVGVAGWLAATKLPHNWNFNVNSERIAVYAVLEKSESQEKTLEALNPLFSQLMSEKGEHIENSVTFVGSIWMDGKMHRGPEYAKINLYLDRKYPYPSELKKSLKDKIDPLLEKYKKQFKFKKLYAEVQRSNSNEEKGQMVTVEVSGGEDASFSDLESAFAAKVKSFKKINELVEDPERFQTSWRFIPNTKRLSQHQLSTAQLASKIRSLFTPDEVLETRILGEKTYVYTEVLKPNELNYKSLDHLKILSPSGASVPLKFLGSWKQVSSLASIKHINSKRSLNLDFKIDGKDGNLATAQAELEDIVKLLQPQFPQFQMNVQTADEKQKASSEWALKVAAVCILGVLFVIAFILGSLTQPFIVGMPIPFGLVGVVLALFVHQEPLGLMAIIGLIGTVGVAVNASIVMVDQINRLLKQNGGFSRKLLIQGSSSRLRAIILTTLTTMGGVFPMAYGLGGESGFTQPLAFSMGWGLSFATLMTLFLVPALMQIREDLIVGSKRLFRLKSKKPSSPNFIKTPAFVDEPLPAPSQWEELTLEIDRLPDSDLSKPESHPADLS